MEAEWVRLTGAGFRRPLRREPAPRTTTSTRCHVPQWERRSTRGRPNPADHSSASLASRTSSGGPDSNRGREEWREVRGLRWGISPALLSVPRGLPRANVGGRMRAEDRSKLRRPHRASNLNDLRVTNMLRVEPFRALPARPLSPHT